MRASAGSVRRRRCDVIISAAGLTGSGSDVTSRWSGEVEMCVVDVAVDKAK